MSTFPAGIGRYCYFLLSIHCICVGGEILLCTSGPTLGTLYVPKGFLCTKSGSGHTSSCHIFCHASHEDHKHNKKYYHRDHGSHCPTSIMQRHHHISATAGPNPLKINDDKVDSLFYNSFQFQRSCFVFRWSGYHYVHPSAKHKSSSLPLQPLQIHQIRTLLYLVTQQAYIRQDIMHTVINHSMQPTQQSTNNTTIISFILDKGSLP